MAALPRHTGQKTAETACAPVEEIATRLLDFFRSADRTMQDLPVYNMHLSFYLTGLVTRDGAQTAIIVTPWTMALLRILDQTGKALADGETVSHHYPSGDYEFITGTIDGIGMVQTCSLFSPMAEFTDMQTAQQAAETALCALFTKPSPPPADASTAQSLSRRVLLFGRRHG